MATEIERKFLVRDDSWRVDADAGLDAVQGYLCVGPPVSVRVRVMGGKAMLNIKKSTLDIARDEFEYPIPVEDAEAILSGLCDGMPIAKTRHKLRYRGFVWEIDVFSGENSGLVVAEIELPHTNTEFDLPPWLGEEVSGDPRYLNSSLSRRPFKQW